MMQYQRDGPWILLSTLLPAPRCRPPQIQLSTIVTGMLPINTPVLGAKTPACHSQLHWKQPNKPIDNPWGENASLSRLTMEMSRFRRLVRLRSRGLPLLLHRSPLLRPIFPHRPLPAVLVITSHVTTFPPQNLVIPIRYTKGILDPESSLYIISSLICQCLNHLEIFLGSAQVVLRRLISLLTSTPDTMLA